MTNKFDFWILYNKFKSKVIKHFLITILRVVLGIILSGVITEIFRTQGELTNNYDYANLLPEKLQKLLGRIKINRGQFIIIGLLLTMIYAFVYYLDSSWEEELKIRGGHYTKNLVLDKFRRLSLEKKITKKDEVNNLIEKDASEIGYDWEHLPNHICHSILTIIGILIFYWKKFIGMTGQQMCFSLFWLFLINAFIYLFTKKLMKSEKEYKERLSEESAVINKERNNAILVESSGLTEQYKLKQRNITSNNENFLLNLIRFKSLNKSIPSILLMDSGPFLLLFLSGDSFMGVILVAFWQIFENFSAVFQCLWDYSDYASSCVRINNFLALPEKNDNLSQTKLPTNILIKAIRLENVSFRYQSQKEWVLKNYNHIFLFGEINYLLGKNGTGKSTIFYLLLGLLVPQEGQIIIECDNDQNYNLTKEVNLQVWRKDNVAYIAHKTLLEKGSTGQKQLTNIDNVLSKKNNAQIFLFDEADNALDEINREKFKKKLKKIIEKGKIVVCIEH